jgi:hypothetical protein
VGWKLVAHGHVRMSAPLSVGVAQWARLAAKWQNGWLAKRVCYDDHRCFRVPDRGADFICMAKKGVTLAD